MSLGAKLVEVAKACRYMTKDGRNDFQKYDYVTAASLLGKVNEALTSQGLYTETHCELIESRDVSTARGNTEKFVVMKVSVTIHDADDPKETVTYEGYGSGQDAGDKAIMKSNTAAIKYAYLMGLPIAMGDDPEENSPNYVPEDYYSPPPKPRQSQPPRTQHANNQSTVGCVDCGTVIDDQRVISYSQKKFGKPLCRDCQKNH